MSAAPSLRQEVQQVIPSKERPILFSGAMVRAILEGRKTQTRRVIKVLSEMPDPARSAVITEDKSGWLLEKWPQQEREFGNFGRCERLQCPYGKPGDLLWVRESMGRWEDGEWFYKADTKVVTLPIDRAEDVTAMRVWAHHKESPHCPSIHMPRWASRLTLEITKIRVEPLHQITDADIEAEGTERIRVNRNGKISDCWRWSFAHLWDSINAKRGFGWDTNPWVWVIEFRRTS